MSLGTENSNYAGKCVQSRQSRSRKRKQSRENEFAKIDLKTI